jgi:enoyl-CoA hydratase/carnithine racemase
MDIEFTEGVGVGRSGASRVLVLSNPGKRNAFYEEMRARLTDEIRAAANDKTIRTIVITGADGHFCAGADLSRAPQRIEPATATDQRETIGRILELYRAIAGGPLPIFAAVEGGAFGAGLSIAAACDVVVAARGAKFGSVFSKLGLLPDCGLLYTLPQRVGLPRAKRLMTLGATVPGEEALAIGLADELVEDGQALDHALKLAAEYEACAPLTAAYTRIALNTGIHGYEDVIRVERDLVPIMATSEDMREGINAFREKRPAKFKGR